jgi:hypothetical protein
MRRACIVLAALALAGSPFSAQAQQTEAYFYDVHGRLQAAVQAPTVGGSVSRYSLDSADNRTLRLTEATPLRSPPQELQAGQFIVASQAIRSADGRFSLVVQLDGNIVLYGPSGAL